MLQRSWGVLKPGGRLITIAAESETTTDNRVKQAFFIVEPHQEQLIRIGELLESGALHPVLDAVLPLTQASAAYTGEVREIGARKARDYGRTWYLRRGNEAGAVQLVTTASSSMQRRRPCWRWAIPRPCGISSPAPKIRAFLTRGAADTTTAA